MGVHRGGCVHIYGDYCSSHFITSFHLFFLICSCPTRLMRSSSISFILLTRKPSRSSPLSPSTTHTPPTPSGKMAATPRQTSCTLYTSGEQGGRLCQWGGETSTSDVRGDQHSTHIKHADCTLNSVPGNTPFSSCQWSTWRFPRSCVSTRGAGWS